MQTFVLMLSSLRQRTGSRVWFSAFADTEPPEETEHERIAGRIYELLFFYFGAIPTSDMTRLVRSRERRGRRINTGFSLDQTSERQRRKRLNVLRDAF